MHCQYSAHGAHDEHHDYHKDRVLSQSFCLGSLDHEHRIKPCLPSSIFFEDQPIVFIGYSLKRNVSPSLLRESHKGMVGLGGSECRVSSDTRKKFVGGVRTLS